MYDKILIHVNRNYHVPLKSITRLLQKPSGRVWVYYLDKNNQTKIAVAKQDARTIHHIVNQYAVIFGKKPFILEKQEKKAKNLQF